MLAVIPARFGSTRFPAKILASETGRPLVQHVVDQVRRCELVDDVVVAADDERILAALRPFGTRCQLTSPAHPSGTDRVAEVAGSVAASDIIVNVQGDEPEIEPRTVDGLVGFMQAGHQPMCTVATALQSAAQARDPNLVKVVVSRSQRAMYFSRAAIPFHRDPSRDPEPAYYLHVGIYAYQPQTLARLAALKPTPCETAEKLEQLRALENDITIGVHLVDRATHGIDTPEQYAKFVQRYQAAAGKNRSTHERPAFALPQNP